MCIEKRDATSRSASRFARTAVAVIARARCRYGQPALKPVDTTSKHRRKARGVVADDARGQPRQPRQPRKSKGRRWRRLGPQDRRRRPRRRQTNPPGTQLQLTTARQEPDFVLSLVFTRRCTTQQAALEGAARRGRCDGLGGLYALLGRAWTYLGWWLGEGGQGVRHGADAHAAAGFAELNKRG